MSMLVTDVFFFSVTVQESDTLPSSVVIVTTAVPSSPIANGEDPDAHALLSFAEGSAIGIIDVFEDVHLKVAFSAFAGA